MTVASVTSRVCVCACVREKQRRHSRGKKKPFVSGMTSMCGFFPSWQYKTLPLNYKFFRIVFLYVVF